MDYLRRPFVRNVKRGARVLVLSDTSHDARVWQVVQSILLRARRRRHGGAVRAPSGRLLRSAGGGVRKHDVVGHQRARWPPPACCTAPANFRAMEAGIPAICLDGGMTLEWFQSGAVTDDMKQIAVRKHYVAKRRLRRRREGVPRHVALRHRLHLPRGRPHLRAAAAGSELRSLQDHQLRQGREPQGRQPASTTCSRPASSTWRRSKAAPTASWSST